MYKKIILFVVIGFFLNRTEKNLFGQVVYHHVSNDAIYNYLDEMANSQLIMLNSVVKPYSRAFIAEKLQELDQHRETLNRRQLSELDFYMRDYNKELLYGNYSKKRFDAFYYKDSLFTFSLNGILGGQGWQNENGFNYHRWYGAEAFAYMGEHWGVYASLRDNTEKIRLADTGMVTIRNGGKYRGGDYSEMQGGITYQWKWGTIALVKDHNTWGNSYRYPNIISAKAPSYAQIRLHLKPAEWFEFNYFHGWLVSEIVDSSRSYNYNGSQRDVFVDRKIAANMCTFKPWKKLNLSFGNSVIYTDQYFHPAYFIPVFFYKSVDHTYNGATNAAGQNSQMFFDISSRLIPKVHMYYSMFIDVMSFSTVFDKHENANHWSMQGGMRVSNILPDVSLTFEYIRNNPLVYKNDNTTLYASNWYNLGHYLNDNSQEVYGAISYRPLYNFSVDFWYSLARIGPEKFYIREREYVLGQQFMESIEWEQQEIGLRVQYQVLNDLFIFLEGVKRNVSGDYERYNSTYYYGDTFTGSFGMNFGF